MRWLIVSRDVDFRKIAPFRSFSAAISVRHVDFIAVKDEFQPFKFNFGYLFG